jgi:mono/diheme cytochrome c family protein
MFFMIIFMTSGIFVISVGLLIDVSSNAAKPVSAKTLLTNGANLYAQRCAACHTADGSGSTTDGKAMKVPDLRAPRIQQKNDEVLLEAITKTNAHKGLLKGLGHENLRMTIMHMRTFQQ